MRSASTETSRPEKKKRVWWWRWTRRLFLSALATTVLLILLMLINAWTADWSVPVVQSGSPDPKAVSPERLRVMAYNVRWGGSFKREFGHTLDTPSGTIENLDQIAQLISSERCDVVALQEVSLQFSFNSPNQVAYLAQKTGLTYWAFAHRYNLGVPFFRARQGVAVLSRYPIVSAESPLLSKPPDLRALFFRNHYLRTELDLGSGEQLAFYSIHTAAHDDAVNLRESQWIAQRVEQETLPYVLAGDFNARPESSSIAAFLDVPGIRPPPQPALGRTYCAWKPVDWKGSRVIDYIFGSGSMSYRAYDSRDVLYSDHLPVVAEIVLHTDRP